MNEVLPKLIMIMMFPQKPEAKLLLLIMQRDFSYFNNREETSVSRVESEKGENWEKNIQKLRKCFVCSFYDESLRAAFV